MNKFRTLIYNLGMGVLCATSYLQSFSQNFVNVAPAMGIFHSVDTDLLYGGNGVSFFDFDNDGWDDITFIQENDSILFYKNNNGVFDLIPSIVYNPVQTRQVLWVDYDNDGDNDLFITATNGLARLLNNDGSFNFTDVSVAAGLSIFTTNNFGVSFADYDNDGFLDFYLARYFLSGNAADPNQTNALYRNNGDGTFTNVTIAAGVGNGIQPTFMGVWIDVDNNSLPDLYVINDRVLWGNTLYINNGDGTFTDYTIESGTEMFGEDPMCATFEDFDNDSDLDIICSNGGPPSKPIRFYINNSDSTFTQVPGALGIHVDVTHHCTWGANWIDVDNDAYRDLYVATGLLTLDASNEIRSYLFMSNNATSFTDSPGLFANNHIAASYGCAKGDINNDGFADLVVQNAKNFNSFIWQNELVNTSQNHYVKITLEGTVSNKMAIGSWVKLYCDNNVYTHYTRLGESFVSQNSQHYIFGVGDYEKVDSIIVSYPSGTTDVYYNKPTDVHYYFTEGETITNEISFNGSLIFCEGESIVLDAGDYESYLWSTGYNQRYLTVSQGGQYSVLVETTTGLMVPSDTINVVVLNQPAITYSVIHNQCANSNDGSISLLINSAAQSPLVVWSNGSTGTSIQGLPAGLYSFNYSDEGGCVESGQLEILEPSEITVFSQTAWNDIDQSFSVDFIIFGGTPPYEITYNGNLVGTTVSGLSNGMHDFYITDQADCDTVVTLVLGENTLNDNEIFDFQVYPNPNTTGVFTLDGIPVSSTLELFDGFGRVVPFNLLTSQQLRIKEPSKGVYYLKVSQSSDYFVYKLVIH